MNKENEQIVPTIKVQNCGIIPKLNFVERNENINFLKPRQISALTTKLVSLSEEDNCYFIIKLFGTIILHSPPNLATGSLT